jgi:hypothetical protein
MVVTDPRLNAGGISCGPVAIGGTLRFLESTVCRGRYTTTQQDIVNGVPLLNTATVVTSR